VGGVKVLGQSGGVLNKGDPKGGGACPPGGDLHGGRSAYPPGGDLHGGSSACPPGGDPHGGKESIINFQHVVLRWYEINNQLHDIIVTLISEVIL
jgi:hypothetical protein